MDRIDWERVVYLKADHTKHHRGLVAVDVTLKRHGGEGLRDATVAGPMRVADAIAQAFGIADQGFEEREAGQS